MHPAIACFHMKRRRHVSFANRLLLRGRTLTGERNLAVTDTKICILGEGGKLNCRTFLTLTQIEESRQREASFLVTELTDHKPLSPKLKKKLTHAQTTTSKHDKQNHTEATIRNHTTPKQQPVAFGSSPIHCSAFGHGKHSTEATVNCALLFLGPKGFKG